MPNKKLIRAKHSLREVFASNKIKITIKFSMCKNVLRSEFYRIFTLSKMQFDPRAHFYIDTSSGSDHEIDLKISENKIHRKSKATALHAGII